MELKENYIFRFLIILTISQYIPLSKTFRTGAPVSKCESMVPGHFYPASEVPNPFRTSIEKFNVTGGQHLRIVLSSPNANKTFKGFLVMVRKPGITNMSFGKFLVEADPKNSQGIACFGNTDSGMTHKHNTLKKEVNLIWVAPKNTQDEEYNVVVTFVESFWTVWDNQVHKERIRVAKTIETDSGDKVVRQGPPPPLRTANETNAADESTSFITNVLSYLSSWFPVGD